MTDPTTPSRVVPRLELDRGGVTVETWLAATPRRRRRERRLAIFAVAALGREVSGRELGEALGINLENGLEDAAVDGLLVRQRADHYTPGPLTTLGRASALLGLADVRAVLSRLVGLLHSEEQRLLWELVVDPLEEGEPRGRILSERADGIGVLTRAILAAGSVAGPMEHASAKQVAALSRLPGAFEILACVAEGMALEGNGRSASRLLTWALVASEGSEPSLALAHAERLQSTGALRGVRELFSDLKDRLHAADQAALLAVQGWLSLEAGAWHEARQLFTQVELKVRALRLSDLVGQVRLANGRLALLEGRIDDAEADTLSALELFAGNTRWEPLAARQLAACELATGRVGRARAALQVAVPQVEALWRRVEAFPDWVQLLTFLGDREEAAASLAQLEKLSPSGGPQVALCRAVVDAASGRWTAAAELPAFDEASPVFRAELAMWRIRGRIAEGRSAAATSALEQALAIPQLERLRPVRARLWLIEAELALAGQDLDRAERALRRAGEQPELLRGGDADLRLHALATRLADAKGHRARATQERGEALASWARLVAESGVEERRFAEAFDRPVLLAQLGIGADAAPPPQVAGMIGASRAFTKMCEQLGRFAQSDAHVLLVGETGVGKELAARALHQLSPRSAGPFVAFNCAAVSDELLLSELFGHEKGAFTGAHERHLGRFEAAAGGTLFLDEVADISPHGQAALLRALQERTFERVGGTQTLRADVRVIAACNRDLEEAVRAGQFRHDLFFRLGAMQIPVPPLRDRDDDAVLLARAFLTESASSRAGVPKSLGPGCEQLIREYVWPGNIRELRNVLHAAELLSDGHVLSPEVLAGLLHQHGAKVAVTSDEPDYFELMRRRRVGLKEYLSHVQKGVIARCLLVKQGNLTATARLLKLSRSRISQLVLGDPDLRRTAGRAAAEAPPESPEGQGDDELSTPDGEPIG